MFCTTYLIAQKNISMYNVVSKYTLCEEHVQNGADLYVSSN